MIVFAPAYDDATLSCAVIAKYLAQSSNGTLLLGDDARRSNLLTQLQEDTHEYGVFMGHGSTEEVTGQHDVKAVIPADFCHLPKHTIFAYCCFSAVFGRHAAEYKWVWWGYDNRMQPPPLKIVQRCDVENIFRYVTHRFYTCKNVEEVQTLIEDLRQLCERTIRKYERNKEISMSASMFFRHLWSRLRVWFPSATIPVAHLESFGGELDFSA